MVEHRTQIKIVGEILDTTTHEIDEYEGTTITHIIRNANISHGRLSRILNNLVSQGLLEQVNSKKSYGGTSFENIKKMIKKYKKEIND